LIHSLSLSSLPGKYEALAEDKDETRRISTLDGKFEFGNLLHLVEEDYDSAVVEKVKKYSYISKLIPSRCPILSTVIRSSFCRVNTLRDQLVLEIRYKWINICNTEFQLSHSKYEANISFDMLFRIQILLLLYNAR
jgi:hypothetical protein